jgi:hypothetical protein
MAITDADRHRLHSKLQDVLGDDDAATLMSHLPPAGWADVATKADLDHLRAHLDARFEAMDAKFEGRFEAMDAKFEARFAATDAKFEAMDTKFEARFAAMDAKFEAVDSRFEVLEARFDASLERAMREQTNRCLVIVLAAMTILGGLQQLLG